MEEGETYWIELNGIECINPSSKLLNKPTEDLSKMSDNKLYVIKIRFN